MRFLIILLFLFSTPAWAEPITKAGARAYYENCKSKASPNMSVQTQNLLCACTAVQMHKHMTTEDVKAMSKQDTEGRLVTNKMIVDVYAPCMQHPAKELYYQNCITDPNTQNIAKNPEAACACMSSKIAAYLSTRGPDVFRAILDRRPEITDPMAAMADDPNFKEFTQGQLMSCLK